MDPGEAIRTFLSDAIGVVSTRPATERGGAARHDPERDEGIRSMPSFDSAMAALEALPLVRERYGPAFGDLTLQLVYNLHFDSGDPARQIEGVWRRFLEELHRETWTYFAIAHLQGVTSVDAIRLGQGVSIEPRASFDVRETFGWADWHVEHLREDWRDGMPTGFYIVAQVEVLKSPDNFGQHHQEAASRLRRAVQALQLVKDGDIGAGRAFEGRAELHFKTGFFEGLVATGETQKLYGTPVALTAREVADASDVQDLLERLEQKKLPHIDLALRWFADSYDRRFNQDKLLAVMTSLEAFVLRWVNDELSFRLAFRVAALLAESDDERVELFTQVRDFYNVRSRVAHGEPLKPAEQQLVADERRLRSIARRTLLAFLHLTEGSSGVVVDRAFYDRLDSSLLHDQRRAALRAAAGL